MYVTVTAGGYVTAGHAIAPQIAMEMNTHADSLSHTHTN